MKPLTILLLRHADKPGPDTGAGVDAQGRHDADSLSVRGWQRAGALALLLSGHGAAPTPQALFASAARTGSRRSGQTVAALAAKLGLEIDDRLGKGEEVQLAELILGRGGVLAVCWQHEGLPAIARHVLGDAAPPDLPAAWPESRYDMLWQLQREAQGWTFRQLPQMLLAGDTDAPIA
ncbi:MAG TPA: hypothetical protein DCW29_10880 [Janthinobacterium sp.]|nr:hypothetical protein [Janthinobacterium sp.]